MIGMLWHVLADALILGSVLAVLTIAGAILHIRFDKMS